MRRSIFFLLLICTLFAKKTVAQDIETASQYMDYISKQHQDIDKKFLSYNSATSHGRRARKVDNLRTKLLDEVETARENVSSMGPFKGDKEYKDSMVSYLKLYYNLLSDDYAKIVNMEDIAEQSYDEMSEYLLMKQAVDKKMDNAWDQLHYEETKFAARNNITLVASESNLSEMMETVGKVNTYYDKIYLVFFKSYKEEEFLLDAISKKNVNAIEQDKNALIQYSQAGVRIIDTSKSFEGDNSLTSNCKQMLQFYLNEATNKMSVVSDYILKSENFEKIKSDFENSSDHSKEQVDKYNSSLKDMNNAIDSYNKNNNQLNQQRNEALNNWNNGVESFMSEHTPKYR